MVPYARFLTVVVGLLLVFAPDLAARRKKIEVVIQSVPEGARVLWNNARTFLGHTPLFVTYQVDGCQQLQGGEVQWASGATATAPVISICTNIGKRQQITFERPADVPGLELDTQVAFQQALLRQMQANNAALVEAEEYSAFLGRLGQWRAPIRKPFAICTTRDVAAGTTFVSCQ